MQPRALYLISCLSCALRSDFQLKIGGIFHTHTHLCTDKHLHAHSYVCTHVYVTHPNVHTCIHICTHPYTYTHVHAHICIYNCACVHVYTDSHVYMHVCMNVHVYMCVHTCVCTCSFPLQMPLRYLCVLFCLCKFSVSFPNDKGRVKGKPAAFASPPASGPALTVTRDQPDSKPPSSPLRPPPGCAAPNVFAPSGSMAFPAGNTDRGRSQRFTLTVPPRPGRAEGQAQPRYVPSLDTKENTG